MSYLVDNIEVDIIDYSGGDDFQVLAEYIDPFYCNIIVRKLNGIDPTIGWTESLNVLMCNSQGIKKIINIGSSDNAPVKIVKQSADDFVEFLPSSSSSTSSSTIEKSFYRNYKTVSIPSIQNVKREEFNATFDAHVVVLPSTIYAIGIKNGETVYQYNDSYGEYEWSYEIELTINHILMVAMEQNIFPFYFLICAHDGYMENYYPSIRDMPYNVGEYEYQGKSVVSVDGPNIFPLLHKGKYVLGQCVHPDTQYVVAMPDRYYFCLNRYNSYRSIHGGIPFESKINKIVYAGNIRGTKYNFITRQDIDMSQRDYFKSEFVKKDNIYVDDYIDRKEMINYKYILDIDGNASTWDATAWKLNSGSVILKTDSNWVQWFYGDYKKWVHYVPVADDFSDIQEKFKWCEENQDKCKEMVSNCKKLFQEVYRYENVVAYTKTVIDKLMKEQCFIYG
jgi:Glycosyl transferase family 90